MHFFIGQTAKFSKAVSDSDIQLFAQITGDNNPVHLDAAYAADSIFGQRIAHGMFTASLISTVLGTLLPGYGSIYLSQTVSFKKPVYIADTIDAIVTITGLIPEKRLMELDTICKNQTGEVVLEGRAVIKYPKQ